MRLLWIGKTASQDGGGDEIYDRKIISLIGETHEVFKYEPEKKQRIVRLFNLFAGIPLFRTSYYSASDVKAIQHILTFKSIDAIVTSWEQLDFLALQLDLPGIIIWHNVLSQALRSIFPGNIFANFASNRLRLWEQKVLLSKNTVVTLSSEDRNSHFNLSTNKNVALAPPGFPQPIPLTSGARFEKKIVLSGSYQWYPKRRDVMSFARSYKAQGLDIPVFRDRPLPEKAERLLRPGNIVLEENLNSIQLGLITDTFCAGHKLKIMYYIANNCAVISFSDFGLDFSSIEDSDFFLRRIHAIEDIHKVSESFTAVDGPMLNFRLQKFKARCADVFSWEKSAEVVLNELRSATF